MAGRKMIFVGGADTLQLKPDGEVFLPGALVTVSDAQRLSLQADGLRFAPPDSDVIVVPPEGASTQTVVIVADPVDAPDETPDESPKRSARKES